MLKNKKKTYSQSVTVKKRSNLSNKFRALTLPWETVET